jgi:hypothetical protein
MDGPDGGDEDRRPRLPHQPQRQGVHQQDVAGMQQEIDPVIAGWLVSVAEDRVVEKIGERGDGPIEATLAVGPPVSLVENQADVLWGGLAKARVLQKEALVIKREAGAERVRVGQQRHGAERQHHQPLRHARAAGARRRSACLRRGAAFLGGLHETVKVSG